MTTPAFVSAGPRIHSAAPLATNLFDAGRTYTTISGATHANFSSITSGHLVAVLTGANAGIWSANGTTTLTFVHDWSAVVDGDILTADQWYVDQGGTSAGFTPPHSFEWGSGAWALVTLTTWPTTLDIPATAAPAGVATGDRILLVTISSQASVTNWQQTGGLDDWEFCGSEAIAQLGRPFDQVRCYTRRWAPGCLPVTIEPQDAGGGLTTPSGASYFYCAQLFAFRPSYGLGDLGTGGDALTSDSTLSSGVVDVTDYGAAIALGAQPNASIDKTLGGFSTANGFTEVHRTPARAAVEPAWRGGDLALATVDVVPPTPIFGPIWVHPTTAAAFPAVAMLFTLVTPDPVIAGGLGWGLRIGSRGGFG